QHVESRRHTDLVPPNHAEVLVQPPDGHRQPPYRGARHPDRAFTLTLEHEGPGRDVPDRADTHAMDARKCDAGIDPVMGPALLHASTPRAGWVDRWTGSDR